MRLIQTSPPSAEPITLDQAKAHLRVTFAQEDDLIGSLVTASRRYCESALKQGLVTQSWTMYLDGFPAAGGYYNKAIRDVWSGSGGLPSGLGFYPGMVPNSTGVIDLPRPPILSVDAVRYFDFAGDVQVVDPSLYVVSLGTPARIQPQYSTVWPIARPTIDAVQVDFTSGYGADGSAVPATIRQAMLLCISHWYNNREWVSDGSFATVPQTVQALLGAEEHGAYA